MFRISHETFFVLFFFMRFGIFCTLVLLALSFAPVTRAQSPIVVESQSVEMDFPDAMRFVLRASSVAPIQLARVTVWQRGVALGSRYTPAFTPKENISVSFTWNFQAFSSGGYLPPGTHGEYTWHLEDSAGNSYDTPRQSYIVQDKTKNWRILANKDVRVSWYKGSDVFGEAIFGRAIVAREFFARELEIENVEPLEIFVYADTREFFEALPPFSAEWTGGRMFPEYGVIMMNIAPENVEWGLRATSHELSHAILHSKIRGTIGQLAMPHWVDEGLAVYNETDDHAPDEHFDEAFTDAVRRNTLIPLRALQQRFPDSSDQAQLAYGQSYSVVKFMIDQYGREKFAALLNAYQQGVPGDTALRQVYGFTQDELENSWRTSLGVPLREISSARLPTIAPRPTYEVSSSLNNTPAPTVEPTRVSVVQSPPPDAPTPAPSQSVPANALCGAVLALGGLVTFSFLKRRRAFSGG